MYHRRDSDWRTGAFLFGNTEFSGHSSWRREGDESLFVHSAPSVYTGMVYIFIRPNMALNKLVGYFKYVI